MGLRWVIPFLIAFGSAAMAQDYAKGISANDLRELVGDVAQAQGIDVQLKLSDKRHFPPCAEAPKIVAQNKDWSTVTVTCQAPTFWKRYIRTQAAHPKRRLSQGATAAQIPAVVLKNALSKGAIIGPDDVQLIDVSGRTSDLVFASVDDVIGREMAINLGAGRTVLARHLQHKFLITKGAPVQIAFNASGIEILAPGHALEDGQFGGLIRVENLNSGRIVKGFVAGENKIKVIPKLN